MAIQILPSGGGTASFNGVFIPIGDLEDGGISGSSEFASGEAANLKRDKALFAISEISNAYIAALASGLALGVSVGTPNKQSLNWTYSFTLQTYELRNGSTPLAPLPVPTSGTNSGVGDFAFTEIFPNATKVASAGSIADSGVLIETAPLTRHGCPAHASLSLSGDNRSYLNALFRWMASSSEVPSRSGSVASAVTNKNASAPSIFSLPAAATAAPNPTTALSASDLDILILVSMTSSITFNLANTGPNPTITAEINSVTT